MTTQPMPSLHCCPISRRRLFAWAILGLLLLLPPVQADEPFFTGDFKDAGTAAAKGNKLVVVDFYTAWCVPCKLLDQTTWKDKDVLAFLKDHCVAIKIDAEKQVDLAKRYKVRAYPTVLFLKADGTELDRFVGYKNAAGVLALAKEVETGKDAVTRIQEKLAGNNQNDAELRQALADALARQGRHEEALKEYLWCLQEGSSQAGFTAKLSLVPQLCFLAEEYKPAMKALTDWLGSAREAIVKGKGDRDKLQQFIQASTYLKQTDDMLAVYDQLFENKDGLASHLYEHVLTSLIEKRRYQSVMDGGKVAFANLNSIIDIAGKPDAKDVFGADELREVKKIAIGNGGMYFEALLGTDQLTQADKVRARLLAVDGSVQTYQTLLRHARRAGTGNVVQGILTAAKQVLSEGDYKLLEADKVPE